MGPYTPGMQLDRLLFVSGQGATDPATGKMPGPSIEGLGPSSLPLRAHLLLNRVRAS
jgi:hypothetical protein